ncbi:hypothetical protein M0P98_00390 [bacterium]|nr:hypothetical protein [bacterium]
MHELVLISNLLKILNKIKEDDRNIYSFLAIHITVNPYSCIDEENLNFMFRSVVGKEEIYKDAKICVTRGANPADREFILDNVEVEVYEE